MRFEEFKIDEITGVKKYHNYTLPQLIGIMADEFNFRILGSGALGTVLQGPDPNTVYKVVEQDDAYLSFVNFAMKNPNPHYPHFKKVKTLTAFYARYNVQPNKFTVIKLEKLIPLPEDSGVFASDLADVELGLESATPTYLPNGRINEHDLTYAELAETRPWIISLWYAIRAIQKSKLIKGAPDLHPGNFMQRQDGTVVIIDPVADYKAMGTISRVNTLTNRQVEPHLRGPVYKKKRKPKV